MINSENVGTKHDEKTASELSDGKHYTVDHPERLLRNALYPNCGRFHSKRGCIQPCWTYCLNAERAEVGR